MPEHFRSPVDLPEPALIGGSSLGWTTTVIATVALLLLVTNAVSIRDWANELTPGPWQGRLAATADGWAAATAAAGVATPRAWLHARWTDLEAARFAERSQR